MSSTIEVIACIEFDLGADDKKVWVIETPVKPGDFVVVGDTIVTLENELATLEMPSPKSGRIIRVLVKVGDVVTKHSPIIEIEALKVSRDMPDLPSNASTQKECRNNCVFLVHGHNEALREMCARLMEKLGLKVIILNEQVKRGETIIEKLERHSVVQFAVVLMTGDDIGGKKGAGADSQRSRARQNVVLELGYFMARIDRKNVCVLYESGVELPSDYYGVDYIEIDEKGAWRYALAKELRQGGLDVDLNKL
ncbi:TIR domain-containing protein [Variovorax humicola]|uniref:TIR domain-containing protein n=1 Tax=Variovorax humicola TaxID=1769758 RepID=A0ABU8VUN3_9BURK